jgi:fatty-acyl-CoA synthase
MKLTEKEIQNQLIDITKQLLQESGNEFSQRKLSLTSTLQHQLNIDSLGRAELFQRIAKNFDVHLPDNIIVEAETLQDIAAAVYTATPIQNKAPRDFLTRDTSVAIDLSLAKTLIDVLQIYASEAPDLPHIYTQDDNGHEVIITYGQLLESSLRLAQEIIARGLRPGDTIAIMQPTSPRFFYTFYGILLAGCIPVPIYPPLRPKEIEAYVKQEAKILKNAEVRMLITFHAAEKFSHLMSALIPSLKYIVTADALLQGSEKAQVLHAKEDDFAFIQYTSGSTSAPKGVLLTHKNLIENIRAYGSACQLSSKDSTVSWLPLYHDLGLIGFWLGSLYFGMPLNIFSPLTFLNRPEQWLWAIHHHRATISGAPNFAYELCVRKIDPAAIEGLDLSTWEVAASGAEAIQPQTLKRFAEKFAPYGFKAEAFMPVYGLAESTVGLAISPRGRGAWIDKINRDAFETKQLAEASEDANGLEFVSCGPPLPGHEIKIVDDDGATLPERHIGYLYFRGPSNMQGYYRNPEATQEILHDGWLDSGDLAYQVNGETFITGRKKDTIIKTGRNLYPTEIEDLAAQVSGIRKGCVIAFGVSDSERGTEQLIVVAETAETNEDKRNKLSNDISEKILNALDIAPDHIILVHPRTIPKTSSGKLQRSACQKSYINGTLTHSGIPAWLQFSKLGVTWFATKILNFFATVAKIFFTCYIVIILLLTLPFIMLSLYIFPRSIAAKICKVWTRSLFILGFSPIKITGKKYLTNKSKVIYASNHASYIDSVLLMGILPSDTRFVGKQELMRTPILRTFMRKLKYLYVNRIELVQSLEDTKKIETCLNENHPIAIFPEGTFSYSAGLKPFKSGAFKTAIDTQTPIIPIALQSTRYILRDGSYLLKPKVIHVHISKPIAPRGNDWQALMHLKTFVREEIAKNCGEPSLDMINTTPP